MPPRDRHHPIFDLWKPQDIVRPRGFDLEFPGVLRRHEFVAGSLVDAQESQQRSPGPPPVDEEYFEWIDVLESVAVAHGSFCMAELGAGYGRWLVRAAVALRQLNPSVVLHLIGVEAEPTHFKWMQTHFRDNGIDPDEHQLLEAAVDASEGEVFFTVGRPDEWYGQAVVPAGTTGYDLVQVRSISLSELIEDVETLDLIDLDLQGVELRVLESAIEDLNRKVKRVHIGTHSTEIEAGLRELFRDHSWFKRHDFGTGSVEHTVFGEVEFVDGVQTWINPAFESGSRTRRRIRTERLIRKARTAWPRRARRAIRHT